MFLILYAIITLLLLYCNHLHSKNRNAINTANLYDEDIDMEKHIVYLFKDKLMQANTQLASSNLNCLPAY